jgi:hypothetical protein
MRLREVSTMTDGQASREKPSKEKKVPFPSEAWFRELQEAMDANLDKYRKLGTIEITLFVKINFDESRSETYKLVFDIYRCTEVKQVEAPELGAGRNAAVIEGDYDTWKEMVSDIRAHGGASLSQTLNALTLPDVPLLVWSKGDEAQLDVDRFFRFNESLQQFFDESAEFATEFRE